MNKKEIFICLFFPALLLLAAPETDLEQEETFKQVLAPCPMHFPRDHGKHPEYRTEWWYFTGNLAGEEDAGDAFGFELTFFRRGLVYRPVHPRSKWSARDIYMAHFAVTSIQNNRFFFAEDIARDTPGLAGAADDRLDVFLKTWHAREQSGVIHLKASREEFAIDLSLTPLKGPVLQGNQGFSPKGHAPGEASYYYSYTALQTEGRLTFQGQTYRVRGKSWMDHEYSTMQLAPDQVGWDWFSIQLDNDVELMLFHLRKKDSTIDSISHGTVISPSGESRNLASDDYSITGKETWRSPHTHAVYPSGWTVRIPNQETILEVIPLVKDQEVVSEAIPGLVYWEGCVLIRGKYRGKDVTGKGYVEMTGYAGSIRERFGSGIMLSK